MNIDRLYKVLLAPRVTEKTARLGDESNQYVFRVASDANKTEIRAAVEALFEVNVEAVRVVVVKGKSKTFKTRPGKRSNWKKAYVRVQEGQTLDFLGGDSV
ncbi:MAG: large subunit ribosomal protein L23 [Lysobacterales bacterium]|jgi:large subunit ribosomal protein L23